MNFINNIIDRIAVYIRLKQLRADRIIKEKVMAMVKNKKTEETRQCLHSTLKELVPGNLFYRCDKCGKVFMITVAPCWTEDGFKEMLAKLRGKLK